MRADLSTIQQTLTPEAASVLSRSIEEAARRRHGQTTPLHVAASLLSSPSSLFRQACASSSSNSPHPLHCRALELCFSVALDRLPSSSSPSKHGTPPVSNALNAALKRAQAHQRRGGSGLPDTPQPPLLAVKVELEQLILSILDDPSVSRVMREASFNSTAVKATIESSLLSTSSSSPPNNPNPQLGLPQPIISSVSNPNLLRSNLYMNPKLANIGTVQVPVPVPVPVPLDGTKREEETKKVFDVMLRPNKRNPILVGDSDTESILNDVLHKITSGLSPIKTAQVFTLDPDLSKIAELCNIIEEKFRGVNAKVNSTIVINLGDLKWLVAGQGAPAVTEMARSAVAEIARLLVWFNGGEREEERERKVWLVGTATCATYLRCQVYHSVMENDWDLQAVPVAPPRRPSIQPSLINPRLMAGANKNNSLNNQLNILSSSSPMKNLGLQISRSIPSTGIIPLKQSAAPILLGGTNLCTQNSMCQLCMSGYEREMGKLVAEQFEKSSGNNNKLGFKDNNDSNANKLDSGQNLPHWLKIGSGGNPKPDNILQPKDQESLWKNQTEELQKKWRENCSRLHSKKPTVSLHHPSLSSSPMGPKLTLNTTGTAARFVPHLKTPSLKPTLNTKLTEKPKSPHESPVETDLSLGGPKFSDSLSEQQKAKIAGIADIDSFKKLLKDLKDKVSWQENVASAISAVVTQCRAGNGKRRGVQPRGDTWLLFVGADRIGKRKMAVALSESLFGAGPIVVKFGSGDKVEPNMGVWGRTTLDRVVEAVRMNPFAVILLEDIDRADSVVRGKIKRAIERGRLPDTHGREVNLGNVTFVMTTSWIHGETDKGHETLIRYEERVLESADSGSWQLELSVESGDEHAKRGVDWACDEARPAKMRKESGLSLDLNLNLAIGSLDDTCEGSRNSSDLTIEHEQFDKDRLMIRSLMHSPVSELIDLVEEAIVFEPVDFTPVKENVMDCIKSKFEGILGIGCSIRVDDEVIDRMVGGIWVQSADLEEWAEKILRPGIEQLKRNLRLEGRKLTVRISTLVRYPRKADGGGLAEKVVIAVDGA